MYLENWFNVRCHVILLQFILEKGISHAQPASLHQLHLENLNKILCLKRFCIRYIVESKQIKCVFMDNLTKYIKNASLFLIQIHNIFDIHECKKYNFIPVYVKKYVLVWFSILETMKILKKLQRRICTIRQ